MSIYPRIVSAIAACSTATALVIADTWTANTAAVFVAGMCLGMVNEMMIGHRGRR